MLFTNLMHARDYLSVQREAARILSAIFERLDVRPMPDGQVAFRFRADVEFLDRMALWGTSIEDAEGLLEDEEDGADADREPDGRDLDRPISDPFETQSDPGCVRQDMEMVAA